MYRVQIAQIRGDVLPLIDSYYLVLSDEARQYSQSSFMVLGAGVAGAGFGEQDGPEAVLEEVNGAGRDAGIGVDTANRYFLDALAAEIFDELRE